MALVIGGAVYRWATRRKTVAAPPQDWTKTTWGRLEKIGRYAKHVIPARGAIRTANLQIGHQGASESTSAGPTFFPNLISHLREMAHRTVATRSQQSNGEGKRNFLISRGNWISFYSFLISQDNWIPRRLGAGIIERSGRKPHAVKLGTQRTKALMS